MINKKIYFHLILLFLFFVSSCSKKEDEKIYLKISDVVLNDIGRISSNFKFDIMPINDSIKRCTIITRAIQKNDSIKSIEAFIQGNDLNISVISYPNNFDCDDDSCYTVHELSFNVICINKGNYDVYSIVNYSETNIFSYYIK